MQLLTSFTCNVATYLSRIFGMDGKTTRTWKLVLSWLPIILLAGWYTTTAYHRTEENPDEKLTPTPTKVYEAFQRYALEPDKAGDYRLWKDVRASGERFLWALPWLFLAALVGLHMGLYQWVEDLSLRSLTVVDKIPPILLLALIFVVLGTGDIAKVAIIVITVFPTIALDTQLITKSFPKELRIKAKTLGASNAEITYLVVFKNIFPRVLHVFRSSLKAIFLALLAAEAVVSAVGIGYRTFYVQRFSAVDVILVYVITATLALVTIDLSIRWYVRLRYKWLDK
ncbi:MAG: ABC transporter permease subunit [bacterium]|nr:ABC transporter permease subunit [bacterium]